MKYSNPLRRRAIRSVNPEGLAAAAPHEAQRHGGRVPPNRNVAQVDVTEHREPVTLAWQATQRVHEFLFIASKAPVHHDRSYPAFSGPLPCCGYAGFFQYGDEILPGVRTRIRRQLLWCADADDLATAIAAFGPQVD